MSPENGVDTDKFYRAYGTAMFAWQEVETELFRLYHAINVLNGKRDIMTSATNYYEKKSFGPKLQLVSNLVNCTSARKYIGWDALEADLREESKIRNLLAHSPVQTVIMHDGSIHIEIADPVFQPLFLKDATCVFRIYDSKECTIVSERFKQIANRINTERGKIPHKFENNQLIVPDE